MGILIAVVIITLVVAAVGAGVYVLIFRAKHKKEVIANSQTMGGGVPVYGQMPDQQNQGQPDFANNMAPMGQPSPAPSPMMNDIMGSGPQNDPLASGMQQAPQPPAQEQQPSPEVPQEGLSVSHSFAPEAPVGNVPSAPVGDNPTLNNPLDLNQLGAQNSEGNLLDDTQTVAPISEMAKEDTGPTPDGDMADFSVPVTKENESLEQVESDLGEAAVSAQTEEKVEQNTVPEPPVAPETPIQPTQDIPVMDQPAVEPQQEAVSPVPEPPVAPEATMPTDASVPQPSPENIPVPDNAGGGQDTDTKEMHI